MGKWPGGGASARQAQGSCTKFLKSRSLLLTVTLCVRLRGPSPSSPLCSGVKMATSTLELRDAELPVLFSCPQHASLQATQPQPRTQELSALFPECAMP